MNEPALRMPQGYFIAGTDTGVGKTRISVALIGALQARGLRVAGMKPVASGALSTAAGLRNEDAERLRHASTLDVPYEAINPYCLREPIAPHLAARHSGIDIDIGAIKKRFEALTDRADVVVVEGVGGWLVPLAPHATTEDLAVALGLPVILVVGLRLGCINHALLTARAIAAAGLTLAGWVANQIDAHCAYPNEIILDLAQCLGSAPLAQVPYSPAERVVEFDRRLLEGRS